MLKRVFLLVLLLVKKLFAAIACETDSGIGRNRGANVVVAHIKVITAILIGSYLSGLSYDYTALILFDID